MLEQRQKVAFAFRKIAINHTLIALALAPEALAEAFVQRVKQLPEQVEVALGVAAARLLLLRRLAEVVHKALNGLLLTVRQKVIVCLDGTVVFEVGVKPAGINHILVYVIEITQNHVTPVDEVIQGLGLLVQFGVAVIKLQQKADAVG